MREVGAIFRRRSDPKKGQRNRDHRAGVGAGKAGARALAKPDGFHEGLLGKPIEIRIASGNSVVEWLLVPKISKLATEAPSARFSFHDMRTADVVRGLKEHSMDFDILRTSAVAASLEFHSIGQIGYALFAPAAWAKERENATTLLSQYPAAVSAGGEFNECFRECCEKAKVTPNLRFRCASFTQVAELMRSGHAVAILPEMAESNLRGSGVTRFEFAPVCAYRREIGIAWHPRLVSIRPQSESVLAGLKGIAG